ncbi:MAG: efflux RND transporter periplasmic adaptor subunit [Proteobacteria bacterium]|nr:efflux RND transporter periplasmic adaptor subunit [Pseudomonadota bacterium]
MNTISTLPGSIRRRLPRRSNAQRTLVLAASIACAVAGTMMIDASVRAADGSTGHAQAGAPAKAALSVSVVRPQSGSLPLAVRANGNIAAWQEASIGTEANGLRLADVRVNVGDVVQKGQVLATFAADTVRAEAAQTQAAIVEAEAALAEASANAERARSLKASGAMSESAIGQYLTTERTAKARLDAQRALGQAQQLRLQQTQVVAPDAGVISARSATVGAVLPAGQELFRMIRQGRLEWRAEVASSDLGVLKPGMAVTVTPASGATIAGTVRMVAPTVDAATRNGLVYVDLPAPGQARAGMYAHGEIAVGNSQALTLPQTAVLLRDGYAYVLRVGADAKVSEVKVQAGRRAGDRIEIVSGLDAAARVVASGGSFLSDGDSVHIVDATTVASK